MATIHNRVSATISEQELAEILAAINSVSTKLPFLINLTQDEAASLPRFGNKSIGFVNDALELVKQNSNFLPRSFNVDEFAKDVNLYSRLNAIIPAVKLFLEKLENTCYEVGAEAYSSGLLIYHYAKINGVDLGLSASMLDELGKRFIQKSTPPDEEKKTQQ
jgi:hypothetical protein